MTITKKMFLRMFEKKDIDKILKHGKSTKDIKIQMHLIGNNNNVLGILNSDWKKVFGKPFDRKDAEKIGEESQKQTELQLALQLMQYHDLDIIHMEFLYYLLIFEKLKDDTFKLSNSTSNILKKLSHLKKTAMIEKFKRINTGMKPQIYKQTAKELEIMKTKGILIKKDYHDPYSINKEKLFKNKKEIEELFIKGCIKLAPLKFNEIKMGIKNEK